MKYFRCNISAEMKKLAEGEKTKLPTEMVIYLGLDHHPALQKKVAKANRHQVGLTRAARERE